MKVKETSLKRLQTVWVHLCDVLGNAKLWRQKNSQWLSAGRGRSIEDFRILGHRIYSVWCYNDLCTHVCLITESRLTLQTHGYIAHQAPPSMGFSQQEYWRSCTAKWIWDLGESLTQTTEGQGENSLVPMPILLVRSCILRAWCVALQQPLCDNEVRHFPLPPTCWMSSPVITLRVCFFFFSVCV